MWFDLFVRFLETFLGMVHRRGRPRRRDQKESTRDQLQLLRTFSLFFYIQHTVGGRQQLILFSFFSPLMMSILWLFPFVQTIRLSSPFPCQALPLFSYLRLVCTKTSLERLSVSATLFHSQWSQTLELEPSRRNPARSRQQDPLRKRTRKNKNEWPISDKEQILLAFCFGGLLLNNNRRWGQLGTARKKTISIRELIKRRRE